MRGTDAPPESIVEERGMVVLGDEQTHAAMADERRGEPEAGGELPGKRTGG